MNAEVTVTRLLRLASSGTPEAAIPAGTPATVVSFARPRVEICRATSAGDGAQLVPPGMQSSRTLLPGVRVVAHTSRDPSNATAPSGRITESWPVTEALSE